jgi:formylglycine-generating enzyme required for sulfatase activity
MPAEHRTPIDNIDKTKLRDFLDQRFSQTDLENLCLNLSERLKRLGTDETITLETVDTSGQGKLRAILKLIEYTTNRGWLKHLVSETRAARKELFDAEFGAVIAEADTSDAQERYREMIRERWSQPRYQLDGKFVNLTLTLDKGEQADERFAEDTRKFSDLREAWEKNKDACALMVLGKPGAGKSTLLRRMQLDEANDTKTKRLTFFISFNEYPTDFSEYPDEKPPTPREWLAKVWGDENPNLPTFDELLAQKKLLLFLDGLNEIPHADEDAFDKILEQWRAFLMKYFSPNGNRAVFSCRELNYGGGGLSSDKTPVQIVNVNDLEPKQIREFLVTKIPDHAERIWKELARDSAVIDLYKTPIYLQLLVEQVQAKGDIPKNKAELFTRYVQRVLKREHDRRDPLFLPGELLDREDCGMIARGDFGPCELPENGALIPALSRLAYQLQLTRGKDSAAHVSESEKRVRELIGHHRSGDILQAGIQLNVLDKNRRVVKFVHQLLQEYFAARKLASEPNPALARQEWRADCVSPNLRTRIQNLKRGEPLGLLPVTGWEETTQLAVALLETARDAGAGADSFVRGVMIENLSLGARCAAAPGAAASSAKVSDSLKDEIRRALVQRIGDVEADLRARIDAGLALGELGEDPRFEKRLNSRGKPFLVPPMAQIPKDVYIIGFDIELSYEAPPHPVPIDAFEIGLYPVTNAEFECFINDGGYADEQWWDTPAALAWLRNEGSEEIEKQRRRDFRKLLIKINFDESGIRQMIDEDLISESLGELYIAWLKMNDDAFEIYLNEYVRATPHEGKPNFWDDSRFNNKTQPVVGVCWHEARAYCNWLSAQHARRYRLPSEAEWEAATRIGRSDDDLYPYKGSFDNTKNNTLETRIRRTTPIGVFPDGTSALGIHDLSGNVWEWTISLWGPFGDQPEFEYPYTDRREERENIFAGNEVARVFRGGSWYNHNSDARRSNRDDNNPYNRNSNYGFRVVRLPSP